MGILGLDIFFTGAVYETHIPLMIEKNFLLLIIACFSIALLTGCGGGGGIPVMESQGDDNSGRRPMLPDEERQNSDPPDGLPGDTPPATGTRTEIPLFNQEKFDQVNAPMAWDRRRNAGLGVTVGIMEEVNSFHPDFQKRIHDDSILASPYPENDSNPMPQKKYIVDIDSFKKYPNQPCLLQYKEYPDCPDSSGDEKYFLLYDDDTLGQLPSLMKPDRGVTVDGSDPIEPEFGVRHGTGVASVAAAGNDDGIYAEVNGQERSLQGIAYDANILVYARPVKIAGLTASFEDHAEYFRNAPKAADVYNFSHVFGTRVTGIGREFSNDLRSSDFASIARAIQDMGRPLIASTGNEGRKGETFPRFPAALPLFFSYLRGQVLAVTAIGTNGRITRYASPCGALPSDWNTGRDGRHYCIAAPGGDEPGSELEKLFLVAGPTNDLYNYLTGTSFAAPMVAGAFAILKQQFENNMSDDQLLKRLMETASRAGRYADADIYGAGLLDLDAATKMVGTGSVSITGDINEGIVHDFDSTLLSTSTAFGDSIKQALQNHEIAAFDELGAPFWYPLNTLTAQASLRAKLQTRYARLHERVDAPVPILTGGQLSLTSKRAGALEKIDMSLRQPVDVLDTRAELLFTAGNLSTAPLGFHEDESFAHPYLGFAGEGIGFGGTIDIGAGQLAAMGFASGGGGGAIAFQDTPPINARGGLLEYVFEPIAGVDFGFQAGALVEKSRALGLLPQGGFGEIGVSSTAFTGISLDGELRESWRFRAQALGGWTNLPLPSGGLFASGANSASSAFRFDIEGRDIFLDADRFDIFVAQPLRIESGAVDFIIPVARTPSGSITRERIDGISLEPSGRELEFGMRYEMQVREGIVATGGVGIVREGGHVGAQATEIYGLGNLSFHF